MAIGIRATMALCLLIIGCTAQKPMFQEIPESEANVFPNNSREEILAYLRVSLKDYRGVRDASISQPFLSFRGAGNRYTICVRFNAKNSYGAYGGIKDHTAVFVRGKLSTIVEPFAGECRQVDFEKFPELEKLT